MTILELHPSPTAPVSESQQSVIREATLGRVGRRSTLPPKPQRLPRVLFVGAYPPLSVGTRAVSLDIAYRLGANGWTVHLTSRQRRRALRVLALHAATWWKRAHYDLAHVDVFSGAAFRWAEGCTALLRGLGKPYVLTLHGGNLSTFAGEHPARVARLLASAAHVTAPSTYLLNLLCGAQPRASVIPNPIDTSQYAYTRRARPAARLLWLRAYHRIYNPDMAVAVVRQLSPDHPDIQLTMVGPDKDGSLARMQAAVRTDNLASRVKLSGALPKSHVPRLFDTADVFLNTSSIDNAPVSVLEAMAAGLCVVSTNVGGIAHMLTHEHDALLVPTGDGCAMAAAVQRILHEPGLAARLSRNARATAERHAWEHVLPLWEALFAHVASQGVACA